MSYDSPGVAIRRELITAQVTGAASATMQKFFFFQNARIRNIHALVVTAGTNAAAAVDLYVGTASVGTLAFGTNTAGTVLHATMATTTATTGASGYIELKGAATSATLVGAFSVEYSVVDGAAVS